MRLAPSGLRAFLMADPRFFDNHGPFSVEQLCAAVAGTCVSDSQLPSLVHDLASLNGAGSQHLAFCDGSKAAAEALANSAAGFCLVKQVQAKVPAPASCHLIVVADPLAAFAAAARLFYPDHEQVAWSQQTAVDPTADIGSEVMLGPGVVVGPGAQIGAGSQIGAGTVIGRGVAIGRKAQIGSQVTISHAYIGDNVLILPGARIGQPGFGFVSGPRGHIKIPQLGRVIIQDGVEIGANVTIDRGALGDTVVGEGTKIDNLVQIGHNCRIGRHCVIVSQVGLSGSVELGDFVVLGGQVGVADHALIGDGARIAAKGGVPSGTYPGGQDYGGFPLRPIIQWRREVATLALLAKRRKRDGNG